ncbi:MAG: lysine--tRNA ligase [Butyrivibrio sp.]|nr:lysine--tRNA ligase [Butyrivibrio sp.]
MAENQQKNQNQQKTEDINQLKKVRREKLADLQAAGKDPFQIVKYEQTHHAQEIRDNFDTLEVVPETDAEGKQITPELSEIPAEKIVSLAGRMMSKRVMGKASFANLQDKSGRMQLYVSRNDLGDDSYAAFKKMDIGDIIGVKGFAFRTKTGEISVHVKELTLLSKSLQPLPEKFHGLTDTESRFRQRYVDLIMNEEVKDTFIKRSQIIQEIRNFLAARDFMEVETPMLVENAGGAAARPFLTHYNALDEERKLRISLELYLKRLIVGGLERVFEIGRVFRNEGTDTRHNPEFTLMELYQAYTDYEGMMELTESMFRYLAEKVCGTTQIPYGDNIIDLGKPFERLTMNDAIKKYAGVDFDQVKTDEEAKALAKEHHIEFEDRHTKGDIINLFFEEFCEKELIQPTFIMDHPLAISPLTKKKPSDPEKVCGTTQIPYGDNIIDLGKPFERLTMNDAIKKYAGVDFDAVKTDEEAKAIAKEHHVEFEDRHTKGDIINLFFEEFCEEKLIQPTFIMDHPIAISPLTKKKPSDPEKVERFELFINTWEMCNAYSELNDPIDQRERFAMQDANAAAGDDEAEHTDEDFLNALEIGMPPTGGIGYGIDRLCMLLTNSANIREVLLFPTLKTTK